MIEQSKSLREIDVRSIELKALSLVPEEFAVKNNSLPYKIREDTLYVAVSGSERGELIARLKLITSMKIQTINYLKHDLIQLINKAYESLKFNEAVEGLKCSYLREEKKSEDKVRIIEDNKAPTVMILNYIVKCAIDVRASDIHFEPQECSLIVRFRIDGSLMEFFNIPIEIYSSVITRLKVLCSMDISEKRIPQDGKYQHNYFNKTLDFRVSTIPVFFGEKIVVRILDKDIEHCSLENIYNNSEQIKKIRNILLHNNGIILVTGPTGSGKSTTLYAMLKELNSRSLNITSIEDPVEYTMKGINQISVNNKVGLTFAAGLRSILRQDPDVIMLGEIRDEETAAIAIRAAITGHLVLSTLHTNDALGAINRLVEMGIERYLLSDAIVAVIAQRLVRKICNACKEAYYTSKNEQKILKLPSATTLYRGSGCSICNNSGYLGRAALSDIVQVDEVIRKNILNGNISSNSISYEKTSLMNQCRQMVLDGITTIDELIKISNGKVFD